MEINLNDVRECEIAALFHDIGKFRQHTFEGKPPKKHGEYSAELLEKLNFPKGLDKTRIIGLARYHHSKEEKVIGLMSVRYADWHSAAMDREEMEKEKGDEEGEPNSELLSIFSSLVTDTHPFAKPAEDSWYLPKKLDPNDHDSIFPITKKKNKKELAKLNQKLWEEFESKLMKIPSEMGYYNWMATVISILKEYSSNVLSAGYKVKPTVSLYNHLMSTAAIARSGREYDLFHGEKGIMDASTKRHLILKGDINGIQSFIFDVKTPELVRKGTSKRLRGRSFYIQILTEAIVRRILRSIDLSETSVLIKAAGTFTILLPNTEERKSKLEETIKNIKDWLLDNFPNGPMLSIASIEVSNHDFKEFTTVERMLNENLAKARFDPLNLKGNPLSEIHLQEFFAPSEEEIILNQCTGCSRTTKKKNLCEECEKHEEIGGILPKAKGILFSSQKLKLKNSFNVLGTNYYLIQEFPNLKTNEDDIIFYSIDKYLFEIAIESNIGFSSLDFSLSFPLDENQPMSFDKIIHAANGMKRLALFKADVDNLGSIFAKGTFKSNAEKSLAKVKEISLRLDYFFSMYLPTLASSLEFALISEPCTLHKDNFALVKDEMGKDLGHVLKPEISTLECSKCSQTIKTTLVYSIFSGGDDLAYIGPWDMMLRFAFIANVKFKEYMGYNPYITLSGALAFFQEKEPISQIIQKAEDLLEHSKSYYRYRGINLKNSLTCFGETLFWQQEEWLKKFFNGFTPFAEDQLEFGRKLIKQVQSSDEIRRSFLTTTLNMQEKSELQEFVDLKEDNSPVNLTYQHLLAYYLGRRYKDPSRTRQEFERWNRVFPWIRFPASFALYATR